MSAFSDPRWFDREAVAEREDVVCRAVPQDDGRYVRHAVTQSGAELDVVTFRVCDGPLAGRHAGLLIWPPRSQSDLERTLGPLAADGVDGLDDLLPTTTVRCRVETSPFGELEVRRIHEVVAEHALPDPAGPTPPQVPADLLPAAPATPATFRVHVIRTQEEVQEAVRLLDPCPVLGLDIETACTRLPPEQREERAAFEPWNGTVRLVQLAAPAAGGDAPAIVIDCWACDPGPVLRLLADGRQVIAHNAKFEQSWIRYRWDVEFGDVFDTCAWWTVIAGHLEAAGFDHGVGDAKLVSLAERFLAASLDKTFQTSDWGQEELSDDQLAYAAEDATVLIPLAGILERIGAALGCDAQARAASLAGARRASASAHFAADRQTDELAEALELVRATQGPRDLEAAGAAIRRLVLSARSRAAVADAYRAQRAASSA